MLINELWVGQLVNLEIALDKTKYEVVTKVAGTSGEAALLEPIEYKSKIIQIDPKKRKNIVFNLYGDTYDQKRVAWYNVNVELKQYKDKNYYAIHTNGFNKNGVPSDRRKFERIRLEDIQGQINLPGNNPFYADLFDISCDGISFIYGPLNYTRPNFTVQFDDELRGEKYNLKINAVLVREKELADDKYLYGCRLTEDDRRFLSYIFVKTLLKSKSEKEVEDLESITH